MVVKSLSLETVCGITSRLPENSCPEVAFAGKSNVGKSSLINALVNRYARTSMETREKWGKMIEKYLHTSKMLKHVFLLVDIRHEPSANDVNMYDWIKYQGFTPVVIATKADKLNRSQIPKQVKLVRETLGMGKEEILIPFSAETKQGRDEIWNIIEGES